DAVRGRRPRARAALRAAARGGRGLARAPAAGRPGDHGPRLGRRARGRAGRARAAPAPRRRTGPAARRGRADATAARHGLPHPAAHGARAEMRPRGALVAAAAAALLLPGCGESSTSPGATGGAAPAAGRAPSVLLITLDTTRADHLGAYGDAQAQTPVLDGLAARGLLFERAWSPAPLTLPSHASILTGLYPVEHGARDNTLYRVGDECLLLSEALAERGWTTGAFVGSVILARKYGLAQGFATYRGVQGAAADAEPGAGAG